MKNIDKDFVETCIEFAEKADDFGFVDDCIACKKTANDQTIIFLHEDYDLWINSLYAAFPDAQIVDVTFDRVEEAWDYPYTAFALSPQ